MLDAEAKASFQETLGVRAICVAMQCSNFPDASYEAVAVQERDLAGRSLKYPYAED